MLYLYLHICIATINVLTVVLIERGNDLGTAPHLLAFLFALFWTTMACVLILAKRYWRAHSEIALLHPVAALGVIGNMFWWYTIMQSA